MREKTFLYAYVLRPASGSDCTNGGVSSKVENVIIVPEGVTPPTTVRKTPILRIVSRCSNYICAEPVEPMPKGNVGYMFGGNFIYSSDSRFSAWISQYPVPVHDRSDTYEDYKWLSV